MNTDRLKADYQFFLQNKDDFYRKYPGKFLVIKNKVIIGVYDDEMAAYVESVKQNRPGTFIIQHSAPGSTEVQVFHSRVIAL